MKSWISLLHNKIYILLFIGLVLIFFYPFILKGKIPIPADTIVGMYHPWRDVVWDHYSAGVPFKNFLITDPVRQQYIWRKLAIEQMKKGELPLWNPYSFSGTPLLANFQTAAFYPLNILFFVLPFNLAWGILILFEPLLAGIFLYFYLRYLNLNKLACFLGSLVFSFCGFFIAWLEWNTIGHVIAWFPLTLLAIEKIILFERVRPLGHLRSDPSLIIWSIIFTFSLTSSFFAGHLQIFFYSFLVTIFYIFLRIISLKQNKNKAILLFVICYLLFVIVTSIQWLPTLQFIQLSARNFDQGSWLKEGWFIPWQHLIQFLAPDFFGHPSTLNYWGEWNYAEFLGYVGILPLIFTLFAIFWRRDKKTWFFTTMVLISLIFALPTSVAKLLYQWRLPFISTSQPTRLLFLTDFSLSILTALGFDWLLKNKNDLAGLKKILSVILPLGIIFLMLWFFVSVDPVFVRSISKNNLSISKRNLILPTAIFILSAILIVAREVSKKKIVKFFILYSLFFILIFDFFRFGWKFTPFTKEEWLFPTTQTIEFLKGQQRPFRFMTTDRKIFPPNFATFYQLEDVAGYDPLYLRSYGKLVAAWDRKNPDINPFSFNRILTPQDYTLRITDLLNVKYVLSLKDELSPKLNLVFQEGETRVYANKHVYPRAFLVYDYKIAKNRQEAMDFLFDESVDLQKTAIFDEDPGIKLDGEDKKSGVEIVSYETQKIVLKTKSEKPAILILGNNFYPAWQAFLDDKVEGENIFRVDFTLRGIIVPAGEHELKLYPSL